METITKNIPALALRGLTVFPRMTASFDVEREISVRALERAMETGQEIFLVTQRELGVELPEEKDLYEVGTVARVIQILRASNSMMRVVMEGGSRARLRRLWQREPFLQAQVELIGEEKSPRHGTRTEAMPDLRALRRVQRAAAQAAREHLHHGHGRDRPGLSR